MKPIGVLALQGGFEAHADAVRRLHRDVVLVRDAADLDRVEGLILPGGESTAQSKHLERLGLVPSLRAFAREGRAILGTCAGLILLARRLVQSSPSEAAQPTPLGFLDVDVERNAYGRQLDSFEGKDDAGAHDLVFIRAPRITRVGPEVTVLATLNGEPILVREGAIFGAAFHPELTRDTSLHALVFGAAIEDAARKDAQGSPTRISASRSSRTRAASAGSLPRTAPSAAKSSGLNEQRND